jgi:uncharacterized protein YndB with AHSA1/START domain
MLKALSIIGLLLLGAVAVVLLLASTKPDTFRIERSVLIGAPPERVFGLINDLQQFNRWNPWLRKDPATEQRYGQITQGPGASFAWVSNKTGSGSMTIAHSTAPTLMALKLDFVKPMEAHNIAEFTLRPEAGGTRITWAMHGPAPLLVRVIHVFFSMERMVGPDFEEGLAQLKTLAEQTPAS